jgi:hypothetical protein
MLVVTYTSSHQNKCPISLKEVLEIQHPVAFFDAVDQPYEYDLLVNWLIVHKGTDPKTRALRYVHEIVILHVRDDTADKTIQHIKQHTNLAILQAILIVF